MKKIYFICMMLFISLSTTVWTACSDDDDDSKKGHTEEPTQPGDSIPVVAPTHDTTYLVTKFHINDELTGMEKDFSVTKDDAGEVTAISYSTVQWGDPMDIAYSIERQADEIRIDFYDDNNADQAYILTLNDQGRASIIEYYYVTNGELDGDAITTFSLSYDDEGNLTSIKDTVYGDVWYSATYTDGAVSGVSVMGEDFPCTLSTWENNYNMDLNVLIIGTLSGCDNSIIIANILGLIPSTPYLIASINAGEMGDMTLDFTGTDNVIEEIALEGMFDITLTTEMQVTEIENAE